MLISAGYYISESKMIQLSQSRVASDRAMVAMHPECPAEIMQRLSYDWSYVVRRKVAFNANCPVEILRRLAEDPQYLVRKAVSMNFRCPEEIKVAFILEDS